MARTVLLADDSVTAQNMGRRILTDAGYEVVTVNNGSAALKKIHEKRPDLIVLDVYMPGYGGLEVCQRLKESGETARIPILLTVGKMEPFKSDDAKRVRADAHIVKPFEASELLAALTKLEDRIVPQVEPSRGRKGKAEKKARSWHADTDPAKAPEEWTEKIAYLAQAKERLISREPEPVELAAPPEPPASEAKAQPASVEPAPEMPVIAAVEPANEEQDLTLQPSATIDDNIPAVMESAAVDSGEIAASVSTESVTSPAPAQESVSVREGVAEVSETAHEEIAAEPATPGEPEPEPANVDAIEAPAVIETEPAAAEPASIAVAVADDAAQDQEPVVAVPKTRWVAETVAVSAEEAALELEQEMQVAQAKAVLASATIDSAPQETAPITTDAATETEDRKGATFAAAAAAASGAVSVLVQEPATAAVSVPEVAAEESEPTTSETAAAWQNWQQIRDSVMTPQNTAAIAESIAQVAKAAPTEPPVAAPSAEENSLESEALASIVDSVLAELKPRLMQEIAKKLKK